MMIDRAIGIFGLALSFIFGCWWIAPEFFPVVPKWAILFGVILGVFLVGVTVGSFMSNNYNDLKEKAVQLPNFMLSLIGGNIFVPEISDNACNSLTGITLTAKIWNTGEPSLATEWLLFVIPENSTPVIAQLTRMPKTLRIGGKFNSTVIMGSDSLEVKTSNTPVQNIPVEGTLLFYVSIKQEVVMAATTRLELIVKDIFGKETKAIQVMGDWLLR